MAPRLDHARLEALVDQSQAVPGGDQLERQREQLAGLGFVQAFQADVVDALQDGLELRQVVLVDEAVLREELVARRQAAEQLDHGLGDLVAGAHQELVQPGLAQHVAHVGVGAEVVHVEHAADRRAEQQVFRDRGVAVVERGIEALDPVPDAERVQPLAHLAARLEHAVARVVRLRAASAGLRRPSSKMVSSRSTTRSSSTMRASMSSGPVQPAHS